jgi:hypothetical protein
MEPFDQFYVWRFADAVFGDKYSVQLDHDNMIWIDNAFSVWKEDGVYRIGHMVYHPGSYEEPPAEDFKELDKKLTTLEAAMKEIFDLVVDDRMDNVSESMHWHNESMLNQTKEVLES